MTRAYYVQFVVGSSQHIVTVPDLGLTPEEAARQCTSFATAMINAMADRAVESITVTNGEVDDRFEYRVTELETA